MPKAEQSFDGIATRFLPNVFDARYGTARVKFAQSALVPSRIFDDTTLWASHTGSTRTLFVSGGVESDGKYHLDAHTAPQIATKAGESRHAIQLDQISSNQYRWDTRVDLALGAVTPDEVANTISALLRAPEGRTENQLREDYRTAFPRATAAFGRGFSIDSLAVTPAALGTASVMMRISFHPELMKPTNPALASYLDKYLGPAKYHFQLLDRGAGNAVVFDIVGRDRAMTLRYRIEGGKLVSLLGPPRAWSDSLTLLADLTVKVKFFTVGFHELSTDFVISNTTSGNVHERGWSVVAQREPKWDLPLITERLIRSPLHRPFEGQGALFKLAVREGDGTPQTMFERRTRLDVQESAIMRFIGSLASHALGDLDGAVEDQEHRFLHDGLTALAADLRR